MAAIGAAEASSGVWATEGMHDDDDDDEEEAPPAPLEMGRATCEPACE